MTHFRRLLSAPVVLSPALLSPLVGLLPVFLVRL
jgi:hypothetical protein